MTNWVLTTSNNSMLLVSDNLKILKFVQLLTSKYLTLFVTKASFVPDVKSSELAEKIKFVYDIVSLELSNIEKLSLQREKDNFHIELIETTKEFLDILNATDDVIEASYNLEIQNLYNHKTYCQQHKKFLFQILFDADYSQTLENLKNCLFDKLKKYPPDSRYVSIDLTRLIINKFK